MPFSNVPTTSVLVAEQDYFYWPCVSGEKYPPTLVAGGGTAAYTSVGLYPVIQLNTNAVNGTATWPIVPAWKFSEDAFAGFTITYRINIGGSNTSNGAKFSFNTSGNDYMNVVIASNISFVFGGVSHSTGVAATQNTWLNVSMTVDASSNATVVMNGTHVVTSASSSLASNALQLNAATVRGAAGFGEAQITQLQVTYS